MTIFTELNDPRLVFTNFELPIQTNENWILGRNKIIVVKYDKLECLKFVKYFIDNIEINFSQLSLTVLRFLLWLNARAWTCANIKLCQALSNCVYTYRLRMRFLQYTTFFKSLPWLANQPTKVKAI